MRVRETALRPVVRVELKFSSGCKAQQRLKAESEKRSRARTISTHTHTHTQINSIVNRCAHLEVPGAAACCLPPLQIHAPPWCWRRHLRSPRCPPYMCVWGRQHFAYLTHIAAGTSKSTLSNLTGPGLAPLPPPCHPFVGTNWWGCCSAIQFGSSAPFEV